MKIYLKQMVAICGLVIFLLLAHNIALAVSEEQFYKGKTIQIVVGNPPGGGYDMHARMLASYLGKYIPGNPKVIVRNLPGVNRGHNFIAQQAKRDGLTIAILRRGSVFAQALDLGPEHGVSFDVTKYGWIGSSAPVTQVLFSRAASGIKSFNDLRNAPKPIRVTFGDVGSLDVTPFAMILLPVIGANVEFFTMTGGTSTAVKLLAMDRGELDLMSNDFDSLLNNRKQWFDEGYINLLARIGAPHSDPRVMKLPSYPELAPNPIAKKLVMLVDDIAVAGRPFAAPPNVPRERLQILRDAFNKTVHDTEYLAKAKKMKIDILYVSGEEVEKIMNSAVILEPDVKKALKKAVFTAWDWKK